MPESNAAPSSRVADVRWAPQDDHRYTFLANAVKTGDTQRIQELLESGVDLNLLHGNQGSLDGCTVLHMAAISGTPETILFLLDHGAQLDALSSEHIFEGDTPVAYAASKANLPAVKTLLDAGAQHILPDERNASVLNFVLNRLTGQNSMFKPTVAHREVISYLLDSGFDINHETDDYSHIVPTVIRQAVNIDDIPLIEYLRSRGADWPEDILMWTTSNDTSETLEYLLKQGFRDNNYNLLESTTYLGRGHLVRTLLRVCEDLSHPKVIETFFKAITTAQRPITQIFLDHGVDINTLDKDGYGAIYITQRSRLSSESRKRMVEWLVSRGARLEKTIEHDSL